MTPGDFSSVPMFHSWNRPWQRVLASAMGSRAHPEAMDALAWPAPLCLDIGAGDEVIVPSFTFFATAMLYRALCESCLLTSIRSRITWTLVGLVS